MNLVVVFLQTRLVQVVFVAAGENALKRVSIHIVRMDLHVLLQIGARSKCLIALGALEWLLSRVDSLVSDQVGHLAEGHVAAGVLADERLHFVVHASVFLQTRVLSELLVALSASQTKDISKVLKFK